MAMGLLFIFMSRLELRRFMSPDRASSSRQLDQIQALGFDVEVFASDDGIFWTTLVDLETGHSVAPRYSHGGSAGQAIENALARLKSEGR